MPLSVHDQDDHMRIYEHIAIHYLTEKFCTECKLRRLAPWNAEEMRMLVENVIQVNHELVINFHRIANSVSMRAIVRFAIL